MKNLDSTGSSDLIAYPDNGTDSLGWADIGITGSNFSDPNYTITKSNDGYFFVQGKSTSYGGNLVIATGSQGPINDIIFATQGFYSNNEVARIHGNNFTVVGNVSSGNNVVAKTVRTIPTTVALLPSAASAGAGSRAFVTDANTTTFNTMVSGLGANSMPVFSNGTAWYIG